MYGIRWLRQFKFNIAGFKFQIVLQRRILLIQTMVLRQQRVGLFIKGLCGEMIEEPNLIQIGKRKHVVCCPAPVCPIWYGVEKTKKEACFFHHYKYLTPCGGYPKILYIKLVIRHKLRCFFKIINRIRKIT